MPARVRVGFIMNRVPPWSAREIEGFLYFTSLFDRVLGGKELGLKQPFPLNYLTAELFSERSGFPQSWPPAEKVAILSYLELCRGCDRWRLCWAFAFKELIKIPPWPENPMKFITLTFYNPPQGFLSVRPTAVPHTRTTWFP